DLRSELARLTPAQDLDRLESAFVVVAKRYAARKGISYSAWRAAGVPAGVLARAGISRSDSPPI
ncbi:MAG TPA: hypothetical protein VK386_09150, partial [Acidimicrobiales bacterium]|nr:hypothetical protein [Acidimicrobiales bacterium]